MPQRTCTQCFNCLPRSRFSSNQWRKGADLSRCKACVEVHRDKRRKVSKNGVVTTLDEFRRLAQQAGLIEVALNRTSKVISFTPVDGNVRFNCYYTTGTVGTCLDHPSQGKTQLFRRDQDARGVLEIFNNPRVHTNAGYQRKPKGGRAKGKDRAKNTHHIDSLMSQDDAMEEEEDNAMSSQERIRPAPPRDDYVEPDIYHDAAGKCYCKTHRREVCHECGYAFKELNDMLGQEMPSDLERAAEYVAGYKAALEDIHTRGGMFPGERQHLQQSLDMAMKEWEAAARTASPDEIARAKARAVDTVKKGRENHAIGHKEYQDFLAGKAPDSKAACMFCGAGASLRCSACKLVYYCCKDHQKKHWKEHKKKCKKKKKKKKENPPKSRVDWANGLGNNEKYEWLSNCYQLRCDDDYAFGGCYLHGPYDPNATALSNSGDFLIFCLLASRANVLPAQWDWREFLNVASKHVFYAFEKSDAQERWGAHSPLFLRSTANDIYGCDSVNSFSYKNKGANGKAAAEAETFKQLFVQPRRNDLDTGFISEVGGTLGWWVKLLRDIGQASRYTTPLESYYDYQNDME